jgi:glyoxalase family protein
MQPLTTGFHHSTLVTSSAGASVRFYRDLLGLRLVKRTVNFDDPGSHHLYFGDERGRPGTLVTFFEWPWARRGRWGIGGAHHLAFGVADEAAQLRWKRRLTDVGVNVSGPYNRGYFTSIYFLDPDGHILEIATAGPGYAIDEPIEALGRETRMPPAAQLRPNRDEAAIRARTHPEPVSEIDDGMRLTGIHHITGITDDLERLDEFYQQTLGLRLVKRSVNQDDPEMPHWFWASYDGTRVEPHSSLTHFGWASLKRKAVLGAGQTHHYALRVADAEQQLEWREHLVSLGLEVSPVMDRKYFSSIYFRAPDGQLLEIATDGPGFTVDEEPAALGSELRLPDWLEPRRADITSRLSALP